MRVVFTKDGKRSLSRLDSAVAKRVLARLSWLVANFNQQTPAPLGEELAGFFKLRIGDWRVIYSLDRINQILMVHAVDHRSKVYRKG